MQLWTPAVFVLGLVAQGIAQATCPPLGVSVAAHGGRLGDAWRVLATCSPSVLGAIGLDLAGGPTATPIGTICLGLTPALWLHGFVADAAGRAAANGVMPGNAVFAGITVYATAVSLDPGQPSGFGLGNGVAFTLRQGRFWFVNPGTMSPFGSTPGAIAATNAMTDDVAFARALPAAVYSAATVPERGWLVLLQGNGTLAAYDGSSITPVVNTTLTGPAASATRVYAIDADTLLLLSLGTPAGPFGGGTPGAVHTVSLPAGAVVATTPLPAGNPDALLQQPGSTLVFLRVANGVVPFEYGSGLSFPVIPLPVGYGAVVDWRLVGNLLHCLHGGQGAGPFGGGLPAAISVIDTTTWNVLSTVPLAMQAPVQLLRAGPGSAGPALFVYGSAAAVLAEYSLGLVQPLGTIPVGSGIVAMELSALGSQWLLVCNGAGCGGSALLQLAAGTSTPSTLASLSAPQAALAVSPSLAHGKACVVLGTNVAAPFGTDPFTSVGATILPSAAPLWWILAD